MRLPGTENRKGKNSIERPHRKCQIVSVPNVVELLTKEQIDAVSQSTISQTQCSEDENAIPNISEQRKAELFAIAADIASKINVQILKPIEYSKGIVYSLVRCPFCGGPNKSHIFVSYDEQYKGFDCMEEKCRGHKIAWNEFSKISGLQAPAPPPLQWESMPLDFFPGFLKDYILAVSKCLCVDPAMVGAAVLGSISAQSQMFGESPKQVGKCRQVSGRWSLAKSGMRPIPSSRKSNRTKHFNRFWNASRIRQSIPAISTDYQAKKERRTNKRPNRKDRKTATQASRNPRLHNWSIESGAVLFSTRFIDCNRWRKHNSTTFWTNIKMENR